MSSNVNDESAAHDAPDALEKLLRDAQFAAPSGLAARLAARARDPMAGKVLFWADVERTSRTLIGKVAAAAVLAAGLALGVAYNTNASTPDPVADAAPELSNDDVVRMTTSPRAMDAIVLESSTTSSIGSPSADPEDR